MSRFKKGFLLIFFSVLFSFLLIQLVQAVSVQTPTEPGTDGDPLVTQGYVDKKDAELKIAIDKLNKQSNFQVVEVDVGKQLMAGSGTEIILRAGTAKGIKGINGGLSDVTSGKDIATGGVIAYNHLLISSRDDGRGIKASTKLWVLVRGSYTIK